MKRKEEETGVSWREIKWAGVISKDDAYVEKETAVVEKEGRDGGKMKWTLGGVLCPHCQIKFRLLRKSALH